MALEPGRKLEDLPTEGELEDSLEKQRMPWKEREAILKGNRTMRRELMRMDASMNFEFNLASFPDKAADALYKKNLEDLSKIGLVFTLEMMRVLTLKKGRDQDFMNALRKLHSSGVYVDGGIIQALSFSQARDSHYIFELTSLASLGATIDGDAIRDFTIPMSHDAERMAVLKELQSVGIDVGWGGDRSNIFHRLTYAKGKSREYIEALKELHGAGIEINGWVIDYLPLHKTIDRQFIDTLKNLHNDGIEITIYIMKSPYLRDSEYLKALKELHALEVVMDYAFISKFNEYHLHDYPLNFKLLHELHEAGVVIDFELLNFFKYERDDDVIMEIMKDLARAGVLVDGNLVEYCHIGGKEKIQIPLYVSGLKKISAQGVHVDEFTIRAFSLDQLVDDKFVSEYVSNMTIICKLLPKGSSYAKNLRRYPQYIPALQDLHDAGIKITDDLFMVFAYEDEHPILDRNYREVVKRLHREGIKAEIVVRELSLELSKNSEFIKKIIAISKFGIDLHGRHIEAIVSLHESGILYEKGYIDTLKRLAGDGFNIPEFVVAPVISVDGEEESRLSFFSKVGPDEEFIEAIKKLRDSGIEIISEFLNEQHYKKLKDPDYQNMLIRLAEAGIEVDNAMLDDITVDYAKDSRYADGLIRLYEAGVKLIYVFCVEADKFNFSNIANPDYITAVIELHSVGIYIDSEFYMNFNPELISNTAYLEQLKRLSLGGIWISTGILSFLDGKVLSDDVIENLLKMNAGRITIDNSELEALLPDKVKNADYVKALIDISAMGINVTADFIKDFDLEEKTELKVYVEKVQELKSTGVLVTSDVLAYFTLGKAQAVGYIEALGRLHEAGIYINGAFVRELSVDKAVVPTEGIDKNVYIITLIDLYRHGVNVNSYFVERLSLEMGCNANYLNALHKFIKLGIRINSWMLEVLVFEKCISVQYMEGLFRLAKAIKTENLTALMRMLKLTTGEDSAYIDIAVREGTKDGRYYSDSVDRMYLIEVQKLSKDQVERFLRRYDRVEVFSELYSLKITATNLTPLSRVMIDELINNDAEQVMMEMRDLLLSSHSAEQVRELVQNVPLEGLYLLVVEGAEEILTTNFRDVAFFLIMKKMKEEGLDAVDFINRVDPKRETFRTFLQVCSKFNKLGEFIDTVKDHEKKKVFLSEFILGLQADYNGVENGVAIAETMAYLKKDKKLLGILEDSLKEAYDSTTGDQKVLYGIIASIHQYNARTHREFFKGIHERYPMQPMHTLPHNELVNKKGEIIQQYFFYNDEDGHSSYSNFKKLYDGDDSWTVKDYKTYVVFSKRRNGVTILKYVNKPECDGSDEESGNGIKDITNALTKKDTSAIQIVHRGHSTHVDKTLGYIPVAARIVYLGSCGGFDNVNRVLKIAEKTHVLATKGTGTMAINDPLLKIIDEAMLGGGGVNWDELWQKATLIFSRRGGRAKEHWSSYVNPSKNAAVQFINAYAKYRKRDRAR